MKDRPKVLVRQIIVRVPDDLLQALERDADNHERSLSQSVRYHLRRALLL
jgi:plasmid stability protein